jgi:serine protease Do
VGLLGKELRNSLSNTWLNYAIPVPELSSAVDDILAGRVPSRREESESEKPAQAMTLELLGITLIPDVLPKTPPFVDAVRAGSSAANAGLQPDDLVLFVNERMASSCATLRDELSYIDRIDEVRMTIQRGQELLEFVLRLE